MKMSLLEALRSPDKYGDVSNLFVRYEADYAEMELNPAETGAMRAFQTAKTEKLTMHPFLYKDELFLVGEPTEFALCVGGNEGWKRIEPCLQRYGKIVLSNNQMKATGVPITREMFEAFPIHLKNIEGEYWIPNKKEYSWIKTKVPKGSNYEIKGIKYMSEADIIHYAIMYSKNDKVNHRNNILPIVKLANEYQSMYMLEINDKNNGITSDTAMELSLAESV